MSHYRWIIDAGHGGIDKNGKYTTAPAKMFQFPSGLLIQEGVVNRGIATKVYRALEMGGINFALVYEDAEDTTLADRVFLADSIYKKNPNSIFVSLHSNAGKGSGFEIFTSPGQTKSDKIADIFCQIYLKNFPNRTLRSDKSDGDADKEEDFYVLRKTDAPAILIENLFFDNYSEAMFLLSEVGQTEIAACIVDAIKMCEKLKPV